MGILCRPQLASELRRMCDKVSTRLWIASPYVGSWDVRKVLGRRWFDGNNIDVRLLTDPEERVINRNTALRFAEKGTIKELRGLHAKLFIVDNQVLLTSANLTYSAFARRHEVGLVLDADAARSAVKQFESWWKMAKDFPMESVLSLPRKHLATAGEDERPSLPEPADLPADPGDFGGGFLSIFGDYRDFLEYYEHLANEYEQLPRLWPDLPAYLEVDGFLDYLYHHDGGPSHKFNKIAARSMTATKQKSEIARYASKFQSWAKRRQKERKEKGERTDKERRSESLKTAHRLLSPDNLKHLDRAGIAEIVGVLNCMNDARVRNRFLRSPKNTTKKIQKAWALLLHNDRALPTDQMTACARSLYGFKKSSVQELLGWYRPKQFPLRNVNVDSGLRFLGYDVPRS
jgi:hypothetical protein